MTASPTRAHARPIGVDLDHTAYAVRDALAWARRLRSELGAVPVVGETLPEFRYLQLRVGDDEGGATLELLEPAGPGFLARFLERHGEGPHHLTFTVPDLREAVGRVRDLGLKVVGESYGDPVWQEAFVVPDSVHATVVQLAQTEGDLPDEPGWWAPATDAPLGAPARLGATHLGSTDLAATQRLFGEALGAGVEPTAEGLVLRWPSGSVVVRRSDRPGVTGMELVGGPPGGVAIGAARIGPVG